jgi:quercetin dioxygenase-like cupin family protein
MRIPRYIAGLCAVIACGFAPAASGATLQPATVANPTPLILEQNEGERRTFRGWPKHPRPGTDFILKVDPENGGSSHIVLGTENLAPQERIETHRHPASDEVLVIQTGTARVRVGGLTRQVHGGSIVFIPANTWVALQNVGHDPIKLMFIFSAPGFEEFMRAASVRQGDKNVPLPKAEDDALQKRFGHVVIYR